MREFGHAGLSFDVDDSGGDGPIVVLLHGFPENRGSWHAVTPTLVKAGCRVLAPDQRGYSPAARPLKSFWYCSIAAWTAAVEIIEACWSAKTSFPRM